MAEDKCLVQIRETLKRSSIETTKAEDILNEIEALFHIKRSLL